ncbi:MAG TPA: carboxymuconolactone decarboxylase family protein [Armatimonadota bacterium]|nr:carboxymuconolactone decarboxylase family protein [Armatimonadota bacterium]
MGFDPREFLQRLRETNPQIRESFPEAYDAYLNFHEKALMPGKVDAKTKELVALGASIFCEMPVLHPVSCPTGAQYGHHP